MNQDKIYEIVKNYLIEDFEVPEEDVKPEANLFDDLELDSIDALDMIGLLESELDIEVDEEELKKMRLVQDVVDYIIKNVSDGKAIE